MAKKSTTKKSIDGFSLGTRIAYLRKLRQYTQLELAKKSTVSQSTIAQIESDRKDPSVKSLQKVAKALDVHIAVLFSEDNVLVFDMERLKKKYDDVEKLNPTLEQALGRVVRYAREIGYL
ncbi:MAG: helix-turn-helix domain-containing protein [Bdellovibrionales bacterium]